MIETKKYSFDNKQYDFALSLLKKESADLFPRWQKRVYLVFNYCIYGYIVFLLSGFYFFYDSSRSGEYWLMIFMSWSALIVILFFVNFPIFAKIIMQMRRMRRSGLLRKVNISWRKEIRKKRWINVLTIFSAVLGSIGLIISLFSLLYFSVLLSEATENNTLREVYLTMIPFTLALAIISSSFILNHFIRLYKKKIEFVHDLEQSLGEHKKKAEETQSDYIFIPATEYKDVARIEREQISENRQEAINRIIKKKETEEYGIQKSPQVRKTIASLNEDSKLAVSETIADLSINPEDKRIDFDSETGISTMEVPDTEYAIEFIADHDNLSIKIISIDLV